MWKTDRWTSQEWSLEYINNYRRNYYRNIASSPFGKNQWAAETFEKIATGIWGLAVFGTLYRIHRITRKEKERE